MSIFDLMRTCIEKGASDLHVSAGRPPVLRLHGHLHELPGAPLTPKETDELIREFIPERNLRELEEVGTTDFGYAYKDAGRFRVSAFIQKGSRSCVMRLIPTKLLSFEQIGLPERVKDLLTRHRGLVLVTGPTGCGKTTTLATMLDWINDNLDHHVVTIEDPIEYYHSHKKSQISQREVGVDVPSFAEAMRRVLRMDPDVILLGEMRDLETTSAAITAAETGHLVFATLHTTGAARTMDRIIDQYPPNQQEQIRAQLSVSVLGVISQVLLPRADRAGRVAAFEVMVMTSAIENHIRKGETFKIPSVIQTSRKLGMVLMDDYLLELLRAGKITKEVALETAQDARGLETRLGAGGVA
jgi:twitching motility protein PilT